MEGCIFIFGCFLCKWRVSYLFLDVSCANKGLGRPIACSINGKHDEKYFEPKLRHAIILQERKRWLKISKEE
jgi:hypothetical protein